MRSHFLSAALVQMVSHKHLRGLLARKIDDFIYRNMVNGDSPDLKEVQMRRYQYLSAMLNCIHRNIDSGIVAPRVIQRIVRVFVQNNLTQENPGDREVVETFRNSVLPGDVRPGDDKARAALESQEYLRSLRDYDIELERLTDPIWKHEYLSEEVSISQG